MVKQIVRDIFFLGQPSEPATQADLSVGRDLLDTLQANREACVGMAANMIGVKKNIIIVNMGLIDVVMFNPVIISRRGRYETEEGCLSLEGVRKTTRYQEIEVEYYDSSWKSNDRNCPDGQLRSRSMRSIIYRERSFSKIMAMRPSQSTGPGVRLPVRKEGFAGGGKEDNDESERNTVG